MKENTNIKFDDVFKEVFEDFEVSPPENTWNSISQNIPTYKSKPKAGFFRWSAAIFVTALFISTVLFVQRNSDTITKTSQLKKSNSHNVDAKTNTDVILEETTTDNNENFSNNKNYIAPINNSNTTQNNTNLFVNEETNTINTSNEIEEIANYTENNIEETEIVEETEIIEETNFETTELTTNTVEIETANESNETEDLFVAEETIEESTEILNAPRMPSFLQKPITIKEIEIQNPILNPISNYTNDFLDYAYMPNWTVGLHFASENIYYEMNTSPKNRNVSHNYTLSLAYNKRDLFFESGLIYSKVDDNGDYYVSFTSVDPIGSYQQVDSVSVMQDSVLYHTSDVMVYDSIEHLSYAKTKHLYHYITIPVLVGYKWHFKNLDLGIKTGLAYQFMIMEEKPDVLSNFTGMEVTEVSNLTPERFNSNIYFTSSAFIHYYMRENLMLNIEPTLRLYNKSFYKDYFKTRNPYSVSLRVGILYNF
jgi:hypothetical protein